MSDGVNADPSANGEAQDRRHILVVDDDKRICSLLQRYLTDNGFLVSTASAAAEAEGLMGSLTFDLMILDVMMPGEDGLSFTKRVRATSDVPILLLTARGEPEDRIAGLERGADDYLAKPFEPRELLLRISTILRRARVAEPQKKIVHLGACRFDAERGELWRNEKLVKLTSAEVSLLRIFAASPGQTFSRSDLSAKIGAVLERTVDVQITRLRRKIEADPRMPIYLQTVRGIGYVLAPDRIS
jgi:two-component system, OmpR family, phosphate regulon response regulator OmpR